MQVSRISSRHSQSALADTVSCADRSIDRSIASSLACVRAMAGCVALFCDLESQIRRNTPPLPGEPPRMMFKGAWHCLTHTVKQDGVRSLYRVRAFVVASKRAQRSACSVVFVVCAWQNRPTKPEIISRTGHHVADCRLDDGERYALLHV